MITLRNFSAVLMLFLLLQTMKSNGQTAGADSTASVKRINQKALSWQNKVTVSGSNLYIPRENFHHFGIEEWGADQVGIAYTRRVTNHWCVGISYSQWNNYLYKRVNRVDMEVVGADQQTKVGAWMSRYNYKTVDLVGSYAIKILPQQYLSIGAGGSYYWGTNLVIDSISSNPYDFPIAAVSKRSEHYFGIITQAAYDYKPISWLSGGLNFAYRNYPSLHTAQIDYGIHFSFYF